MLKSPQSSIHNTHTRTYTHTYTNTYTQTHTHNTQEHTHRHTHAHTQTHTHKHIHTNTHTTHKNHICTTHTTHTQEPHMHNTHTQTHTHTRTTLCTCTHTHQNTHTYLGHTVGNGQVGPKKGKIAAVKAFPVPKTKKDVRAFLGLTGYYHKFIPKYATLAAPLTELTKKQQPNCLVWNAECAEAFEALKRHLCTSPVLICFCNQNLYIVERNLIMNYQVYLTKDHFSNSKSTTIIVHAHV